MVFYKFRKIFEILLLILIYLFITNLSLWSLFLDNAKLISNKYDIHIHVYYVMWFVNFYKKKLVTIEDGTLF